MSKRIDVHCPVCGRYASVLANGRLARHHRHDVDYRSPLFNTPCPGGGANMSEEAERATAQANLRTTNERLERAIRYRDRAKEEYDRTEAEVVALQALIAEYKATLAKAPDDATPVTETTVTMERAT